MMDIDVAPVMHKPIDETLLARFRDPESVEEVRETANKLEGVFLSMMLEKMRTSFEGEGGLFGEMPGADTYGGMFDQMMGEELTRRGGLGIAEMVLRSFTARTDISDPTIAPTDAQAEDQSTEPDEVGEPDETREEP